LTVPVLVAWSYGGFIVADYVRAHSDAEIAGINLALWHPANPSCADRRGGRRRGPRRRAISNPSARLRIGAQPCGRRNHRRCAVVDGFDDLRAINAVQ
jgi:hypothetical protein